MKELCVIVEGKKVPLKLIKRIVRDDSKGKHINIYA